MKCEESMPNMLIKPWEMGETTKSTGIPTFCIGDFILTRLAAPKGKTIQNGLVATFLMSAYYDDNNQKIETIEVAQSEKGYNISFPLGKRGLLATKFRGPKSYHRWKNPETGEPYKIPQENFTIEYATDFCSKQHENWNDFDALTKETYINDYLFDMYSFAISQDLALPYSEDSFTAPIVGMSTKLYRVYTPPSEGEKYGNVIVTKWHKGKDALSGDYREIAPELATSIYDEWIRREENKSIDPTSFVEEDDAI